MDILLIAGLWLGAPVWDNVAAQLRAHGHRAVPVALPGQGDGNTSATLADQVAAVLAAVDAAAGTPMVVGHSGGVQPGVARRRGRTPPIWTTRPSTPSRRLRSRCRKGSRAAWSGWPTSAAMTSRWW